MADNCVLIVESDELYQPIGEAATAAEAEQMAREYLRVASPDNPNTDTPPERFVLWYRNPDGYYTIRVPLEIATPEAPRA